jgi:hypothetical protein
MSDLEDLSKQQTSDDQIEGQSIQSEIFEEFCGDLESTDSLSVTDQEFQALSGVSLLGILNSKEDVMFILRQIRESMKPAEAQVSEPPDSTHTPGRKIDEPMRDFHKITETIRRAALAKLDDLDLQAARRSRTAVGRLESAWRCVTMMLSRVHSFVAQVSHKLVRRSVISLPV